MCFNTSSSSTIQKTANIDKFLNVFYTILTTCGKSKSSRDEECVYYSEFIDWAVGIFDILVLNHDEIKNHDMVEQIQAYIVAEKIFFKRGNTDYCKQLLPSL